MWRKPSFRLGSALVVGTTTVAMAMAVVLGFELAQRESLRAQAIKRVDSFTATAFLLDREFLRFQSTIDAYLHSNHPPDIEEVRFRLDILASKVNVTRESASTKILFEDKDNVAIINNIAHLVSRADSALRGQEVNREALSAIADDMSNFTVETQALGNAADHAASRLLEQQNRDLLTQNLQITTLTTAQLVLLMAIAAGLVWRSRTQQREQRELQALNERLSQAQQAAEQASLGKSMFLANMSHELRTPFNGIVGLLDVLSTTELNAEQADLVDTVKDSASHLLRLLNDILDMSALEAGKISFHLEPINILTVLEDVEAVMRPLAEQKNLTFKLSHELPASSWMSTDPTRLRQILFNLINNAIKFTEHGGVCLCAKVTGDAHGHQELRLDIADSGIGMDPASISQLFQRFFQVDSGLSRRFSGAGLGLEISMSLAHMMDGDIKVQSIAGQGSTFTVHLPWIPASKPTTRRVEGDAKAALTKSQQALTILVAEDHVVNQKFLALVLQRMGHNATFCDNGALAIDALMQQPFDAILMDVHMPVMDGLSATRAIRAMNNGRQATPIIALTADVLEEAREQAIAAGVDTFLTKPVQLGELRQALDAIGSQTNPARLT